MMSPRPAAVAPTGSLLRLVDVAKSFGDEVSEAVLTGVNLEVQAGTSTAIVGPSGSGKSTLLHIAGTLDSPSSGRVEWCGQDVVGWDEAKLAHLRNRELGFVFQHHYLLPQCTALENVLVPTLAEGRSKDARDNEIRARALLERVGLGQRCDHRPGQLSGGERQRVAVVRALINGPRLLLADEPTGSLDAHSAEALGDLFVELNREEGLAILLVTHSIALGERMGRLLELREGVLQFARAHTP